MRQLFVWLFKLNGWKIEGPLPEGIKRAVIIAAPHTTNWDFVYALAAFYQLKTPLRFLAKKELFWWPFKLILESIGGIAVKRNKKTKLVDDIVTLFEQNEDLMLLIPAEGTRSWVTKWKTGFYHVALNAKVPVLLGYLDYEKKTAGFGPLLYMTGNPITDANTIKDFYRHIKGKYPKDFNLEGLDLG